MAVAAGADVVVCEPNPYRRSIADRLGLRAVDPAGGEVPATLDTWTGGAGVDAAFEVSGSVAGLDTATSALRVRGRLIVVAIHSQPVPVDLFRVFWRELVLVGARVYERPDFEEAVKLLGEGVIPVAELISAVEPLDRVPAAFEALESGTGVMKVLIDCQAGQ